jgi:hypothetical protein
MDRLQIIKNTRQIAINALVNVLKIVLPNTLQVSEAQFRNLWLGELRKHQEIFPDGWYIPPPSGMVVLFANEKNLNRANWQSIRPKESWPKENIFLNKTTDLVQLYAGPVDKSSGMMGDFGITLYFGQNIKIINHLKSSLVAIKEIFEGLNEGMQLRDVSTFGHDTLMKRGIASNLVSTSDPSGTNIGHTIPFTDEDITPDERNIIRNLQASASWKLVSDLLSKRRKFLNDIETFQIKRGLALTLEPRPQSTTDISIPMVYFHTIAIFHEDGRKELLTGFDEIFKLTRMNYMLN